MSLKKFRRCAGAIVFNGDKKVLLGSRVETEYDSWQFPQGGIEDGESPIDAAKRELWEEMGVTSVVLVANDDKPLRYEFSEDIKQNCRKRGIFNDGQDIYFSLFYFTGDESEINVQTEYPEFSKYIWSEFEFAVKEVIAFKRDVYQKALEKFMPIIDNYKINGS